MAVAIQYDPHATDTRAACQARLDRLVKQSSAISFACLGTVDGRFHAYASPMDAGAPQRLAAITSSLLALSESFAKEGLRSKCSHAAVATEHGTIVTVRIPCASRAYALSVGADSSELLAMTLRNTLDCADDIAAIIDGRA